MEAAQQSKFHKLLKEQAIENPFMDTEEQEEDNNWSSGGKICIITDAKTRTVPKKDILKRVNNKISG